MHETVQNLINIQNELKQNLSNDNQIPNIIAVSKTFKINHINHLIEFGHLHYGENKVQEALEKWREIKKNNDQIKLHLIGKLQSNKVKFAVKLFDFIHSLDNEKLAKKISDIQTQNNISTKIFIQVNIGEENQKTGINKKNLNDFFDYCKELNLNIIGLMCIPPVDKDSKFFFKEMNELKTQLKLRDLSMGMSADYVDAVKNGSTFVRVGSSIFGSRS